MPQTEAIRAFLYSRIMKRPSFQFYTGDWMKDPNLSMCSPATRGIWVDLLCAMHENDRAGFLASTIVGFSRICRCSVEEILTAFEELKTTETADFSDEILQILSKKCSENVQTFPHCNEKVTVICRRMYKDAKARESGRNRVKRFRKTNVKRDCNEKVTSPSSSSSSTSYLNTSTNSERVRAPALDETSFETGENQNPKPSLKTTLIDDNFALTSAMRQWATEMRIPPEINLITETEIFKNRHLSKATLTADWFAEWKNWILTAQRLLKQNKNYGRPKSAGEQPAHDFSKFNSIEFEN